MTKIDELAALVAAASQEKWKAVRAKTLIHISDDGHLIAEIATRSRHGVYPFAEANADAIVALRNHADALLAVARAAKRYVTASEKFDACAPDSMCMQLELHQSNAALADALERLEAAT